MPPEDQTLLILRVNRKLDWREIALVMLHEGATTDQVALDKEAARLRKRYQLTKEKLRRMVIEQGLVRDPDDG